MSYKDPEKQRQARRESYERTGLLERRKERKASIFRFLRSVKVTSGCLDCGFNSHAIALDFDHRPEEEKKFTLRSSELGHRGWQAVVNEIMKCDVRCANCHRIITEERGQFHSL